MIIHSILQWTIPFGLRLEKRKEFVEECERWFSWNSEFNRRIKQSWIRARNIPLDLVRCSIRVLNIINFFIWYNQIKNGALYKVNWMNRISIQTFACLCITHTRTFTHRFSLHSNEIFCIKIWFKEIIQLLFI